MSTFIPQIKKRNFQEKQTENSDIDHFFSWVIKALSPSWYACPSLACFKMICTIHFFYPMGNTARVSSFGQIPIYLSIPQLGW
jgi:hypothetical protein